MLCSPFAVGVGTLACLILVLFTQQAAAQVTRQTKELPHVAYGAIFGTGIYNINDRTVTLFRIPFSYQIRDLTEDDFGIKLRLPVTISLSDFDFDDILGVERDDASSIGFVPKTAP